MSGALQVNCCEICRKNPQKKTYEKVYWEEFFHKTDAFAERL